MKSIMGGIVAAFLVWSFFLILLWPFAIIWALNTLFGLGIDYNIQTYMASLVLYLSLRNVSTSTGKSSGTSGES